MGLDLDEDQIDDIVDIRQEIWMVDAKEVRTQPFEALGECGRPFNNC